MTRLVPNSRLTLRAEMKLPGIAVLDFQLEEACEHQTEVVMTARFRPRGLLDLAYWHAVLPLHELVFPVMLSGIKKNVEL